MAKKIRIISTVIIALILLVSFCSIGIINAKTVDTVSTIKVVEQGKESSCKIKWNKVKGADGYYIYKAVNGTENYEEASHITDGKIKETTIGDLTPSTLYTMKIKAYKLFKDKEYLSDASQVLSVYTCPEKMIPIIESRVVGGINLYWTQNTLVSGYEIQYTKSADFNGDDVVSQTIEDNTAATYEIAPVEELSVQNVRIRAYLITSENKKAFGEWSDAQSVTVNNEETLNRINKDKPMVALTFDDGPAFNGATGRILDVLEQYGARATFFMVGSRINEKTSPYLQREVSLGCELGNHTYAHNHYGKDVTANDIKKCSDKIISVVGQGPTAFRCPGGKISPTMRNEALSEGMAMAYWSVDTEDWKSKNKEKIIKRVKSEVYDGSIILMHDIYTTTADAVEVIVPYLIEKGYQIVTFSELIEYKTGEKPIAGEQYVDYNTINNKTK